MFYFECESCGARLSNFEGGHTTKCPRCGRMATFAFMGPSGEKTDFHKPVKCRPSQTTGGVWREGSSRRSRWWGRRAR